MLMMIVHAGLHGEFFTPKTLGKKSWSAKFWSSHALRSLRRDDQLYFLTTVHGSLKSFWINTWKLMLVTNTRRLPVAFRPMISLPFPWISWGLIVFFWRFQERSFDGVNTVPRVNYLMNKQKSGSLYISGVLKAVFA